jgi:hypothetical protein
MLKVMARLLIYAGIGLVVAGLVAMLVDRAGIHLGRIPGDIRIEGRRGTFYFPIVTCLLISLVLTLISYLVGRR